METTFDRLSKSVSSLANKVKSGLGDPTLVEPAYQLLTETCNYLLESESFKTSRESTGSFESTKRSLDGKSITLKITPLQNLEPLSNTDVAKIESMFLDELKTYLKDDSYDYYSNLVIAHSISEDQSYYFIQFNRAGLSYAHTKLKAMKKELDQESSSQRNIRKEEAQKRLEKNAQKKYEAAELNFNSMSYNDSLFKKDSQSFLKARIHDMESQRNAQMDIDAHREINSLIDDAIQISSEIKENIRTFYSIFLRFNQAIQPSMTFRSKLLEIEKFRSLVLAINDQDEDPIGKVIKDADMKCFCFIHFIEINSKDKNTLKRLFSCADPETDLAKFSGYKANLEKIGNYYEDKEIDNTAIINEINDALCLCYLFVEAEQRKYTDAVNCIIDATRPGESFDLKFQLQFEEVFSPNKVMTRQVQSVQLEVIPNKCGIQSSVSNLNVYTNYVDTLKNILGEERLDRLITSFEIKKASSGINGNQKAVKISERYYLYLNLIELQKITLADVMKHLSADDLTMYSMMREERFKEDQASSKTSDKVISTWYRDCATLYEVYVKFKQAMLSKLEFTQDLPKIEFLTDPDFQPDKKYAGEKLPVNEFVQFIDKNYFHLIAITGIFKSQVPDENRVKCDEYVNLCRKYSQGVHQNPLTKKWFLALEELVKCCVMIANDRLMVHQTPEK